MQFCSGNYVYMLLFSIVALLDLGISYLLPKYAVASYPRIVDRMFTNVIMYTLLLKVIFYVSLAAGAGIVAYLCWDSLAPIGAPSARAQAEPR